MSVSNKRDAAAHIAGLIDAAEGGIVLNHLWMSDCLVTRNRATNQGGGLLSTHGYDNFTTDVVCINVTFSHNRARQGSVRLPVGLPGYYHMMAPLSS